MPFVEAANKACMACVGVVLVAATAQAQSDATLARARADIDHGRYAEALKALEPGAQAAPGGDAALELGLLQLYVGHRADAGRTLRAVVARNADTRAPAALLRAGRASR